MQQLAAGMQQRTGLMLMAKQQGPPAPLPPPPPMDVTSGHQSFLKAASQPMMAQQMTLPRSVVPGTAYVPGQTALPTPPAQTVPSAHPAQPSMVPRVNSMENLAHFLAPVDTPNAAAPAARAAGAGSGASSLL